MRTITEISKGCGEEFYITEKVGKRTSGHSCICGRNKWKYLCPQCQAELDSRNEMLELIGKFKDRLSVKFSSFKLKPFRELAEEIIDEDFEELKKEVEG